ncbi:MAG: acyl-CoA mutase large subunit family protein [Leptospiraceae bacterium]|nr:acyl-CoA mutase large subunit family protein [Leptospiraceae bacterium]MCP5494836.1 acyl-CoA mutase large subunit family protein [Leptospiraceae bacterium]
MNSEKQKLFSEFPPITTEEWENQIIKDLKGKDYDKALKWNTGEGFVVKPYYREEDLKPLGHLKSFPGVFPYIRGGNPVSFDWKVCEDITHANIESANHIALHALQGGADSLGFHTKVSKNQIRGVAIQTQSDMKTLLKDIQIQMISTNWESGEASPYIFCLFLNEAKERGLKTSELQGSLGYNPLGSLMVNGELGMSSQNLWKKAAEIIKFAKGETPLFKAVTVNASQAHNSGASIVQELAFCLAMGNEYLAKLTDLGLGVDEIASSLRFHFSIGSNYFFEMAKFRAFRLLWSNILSAYGSKSLPASFIHGSISQWNKTVYDPYVNMLRGTTEAMSGALGGCNEISVTPFDFAYSDGDDFSHRIARNTQHILKAESYLAQVVDPGAGSYYIESLTDEIANQSWAIFQTIEGKGGFVSSLKEGYIQSEIQKTKTRRDSDIATRKEVLLGTNQYPNKDEMLPKVKQKPQPVALVFTQKKCDPSNLQTVAKDLASGAAIGDMLSAVQEASDFKVTPLEIYRASEAFEELRLKVEGYKEKSGKALSVFLLPIGNLGMRIARSSFTSNFFGCAGFTILDNPAFQTIEEGVSTFFAKGGAEILVLCSSDEEYATLAPELCRLVKQKKPDQIIIVAGFPKEIMEQLKTQGIDDFIHVRSNVLETLRTYIKKLGV